MAAEPRAPSRATAAGPPDPLFAGAIHVLPSPRWGQRLVRHVPGLDGDRLNLIIHRGDQMFSHSLAHHRDADAALSQYFAIALQQQAVMRQVLDLLPGPRAGQLDLLDFACGYGRLLRLLGAMVAPERTWASDLQAEAVAFVQAQFGVHGLLSDADPRRFVPGRRFDVIWVASLFSHLPESLFRDWLARLLDLLDDDGLLCFSVRDASLLPADLALPPGGLFYAGESENADLDPAIYGTAYASEDFVRAALAQIRPGLSCWRLPRALANEQDLYVVASRPGRDLAPLATLRRGPWGWVDIRRLGMDGRLDLQGWAASLDDGEVAAVRIGIDGQWTTLRPSIARPDVAAAFADPRMASAGWRFELTLPTATAAIEVEVEALSARDERALLFAGTLTAA